MRIPIISIFILISFYVTAQKGTAEKSEPELVADLESSNMDVREAAAAHIQDRLAQNNNIVQQENIIEHTREHWEKIITKFRKWTAYDKLEKAFNLDATNRKTNLERTKAYRLDHHYVLSVDQNEKGNKARVTNLVYKPKFYNVTAPRNYTGTWKIFNVNGLTHRETIYNQGKKHGLDIIFHSNGTACWSKVYFLDSIMEMSHFSENGDLISKKVFDDESRAQWEKEEKQEQTLQEDN